MLGSVNQQQDQTTVVVFQAGPDPTCTAGPPDGHPREGEGIPQVEEEDVDQGGGGVR